MPTPNDIFQKLKSSIPLVVLTCLCLWTVSTLLHGNVLMLKHYLAFVAVGTNWIVYFFFRKKYFYVLGFTLLMGLVGAVNFVPQEVMSFVRMGSLTIKFQPTSFLLIIMVVVLNFSRLKSLFKSPDVLTTGEGSARFNELEFEEEIRKFQSKYVDYSSDDLVRISEDNRYTPAALEAARRVLNERQSDGLS